MPITIRTPAYVQTQGKGGLLVPIGLFDVLKFEKTAKRQISIIREKGFRFPTNGQCLVYKIAIELHRHISGKIGVRIVIQKNIPPHKGFGSWASASAGTMLALNKLWNLRLSEKELAKIADKVDPSITKILKIHFKSLKSKRGGEKRWVIAATPKLIEIDRDWIQKLASRHKFSSETVAESHFPDLRIIREALAEAGWKNMSMVGLGPATIGFSEKKIGIAKIPKIIRSKLDFVWIGNTCNGEFKLLD